MARRRPARGSPAAAPTRRTASQRIKDLGFNAIWITPVVVNQISQGDSGGYHGYWGIDFTTVDPHLGTEQDFADFVDLCAQPRHEGDPRRRRQPHRRRRPARERLDVLRASPYRDCHGKVFDPATYVGKSTFPCLSAEQDAEDPVHVPGPGQREEAGVAERPHELPRPRRRRLLLVQPAVLRAGRRLRARRPLHREARRRATGSSQIYADWITKYKLDGFRVDTARHVNAGFWRLWVPKMIAAAKSVGVNGLPDLRRGARSPTRSQQSTYVRDRGLPSVLDFPFQDAATRLRVGRIERARGARTACRTTTTTALPDGADPTPPTFLGNHDMGRAAYEIAHAGRRPHAATRSCSVSSSATTSSTSRAARRSSTTATRSG